MDAVMRVKNGATSRPRKMTPVARLLLFVLTTSGFMFASASAQSSENCTTQVVPLFFDFDTPAASETLGCDIANGNWTRGTDPCDPNSFVPYTCHRSCEIPIEDYFSASPVYFSCGGIIFQFKSRPIVNFTVPNFLIAGETMTVVSLLTAVPRPTALPFDIELRHRDSEGNVIRENITSFEREVVSNNHTYIRFHSFTIPRMVPPDAVGLIVFTLPEETIDNPVPIYDGIPIIPGGPEPEVTTQPTTKTEPGTMATSTEETEQPTSTATDGSTPPPAPTGGFKPACPVGSEAVAVAAVVSAVVTSVVSVVTTVLVVIFCRYKKINQEKHESLSNGIPNSLPLRPIKPASVGDYPTPTPSSGNGITPTMETALLPASDSRRRGTSYSPSRSMSATNRQYSRYSSQASDSPTMTTPNSLAPPIYREHNEASAAAAASSPIIHVTGGTRSYLHDSGAIAGSPSLLMPDQEESVTSQAGEKHIYSKIPISPEELPRALRPLPATPPHSNLPSSQVPSHMTVPFDQGVNTAESAANMESPYEKHGENMNLPHQGGDVETGDV